MKTSTVNSPNGYRSSVLMLMRGAITINRLEWIQSLINEDRLEEFYTWSAWRKVRLAALKRDNFECQNCKRNGRLTLLLKPGEVDSRKCKGIGHHVKPLKQYPELALDVNNIESECWACHNEIEKKNDKNILTEEWW